MSAGTSRATRQSAERRAQRAASGREEPRGARGAGGRGGPHVLVGARHRARALGASGPRAGPSARPPARPHQHPCNDAAARARASAEGPAAAGAGPPSAARWGRPGAAPARARHASARAPASTTTHLAFVAISTNAAAGGRDCGGRAGGVSGTIVVAGKDGRRVTPHVAPRVPPAAPYAPNKTLVSCAKLSASCCVSCVVKRVCCVDVGPHKLKRRVSGAPPRARAATVTMCVCRLRVGCSRGGCARSLGAGSVVASAGRAECLAARHRALPAGRARGVVPCAPTARARARGGRGRGCRLAREGSARRCGRGRGDARARATARAAGRRARASPRRAPARPPTVLRASPRADVARRAAGRPLCSVARGLAHAAPARTRRTRSIRRVSRLKQTRHKRGSMYMGYGRVGASPRRALAPRARRAPRRR